MKQKRFFILSVVLYLVLSGSAYAQTIVQGTVTDALTHEPLQGVSIRPLRDGSSPSVGSNLGQTDSKGKFSITVEGKPVLSFEMVGYNTSTADAARLPAGDLRISMEPSSVDLQPVIVSANRERQSRGDAPLAISKVSSTQIKDTKATALYQLINKVAGVYMVNLGNEQHTMAIRQPITYNALYLYMEDGIPIRPTGLFNHNALYEINMSGLRDIEVIKGPASSLYGSNAIGGAINFVTQGPPAGYSTNVSVQGDRYNYGRIDADGGMSSGKLGIYAGGYLARQKDSWQDYSDFDKYSGNFKSTYDFNSATRLTATASYNYLNTQTPGSLDKTRFESRSYGSNQRFTYRKVKSFRATARIDHAWNERSNTSVTAFFRDNSTGQLPSYFIADVRNSSGVYQSSNGQVNEQTFQSYGFLAQHRLDFNFLNSKLIAGAYLDRSPSSYYAQFLNIQKDVSRNFYTGFTNTGTFIDDYRIDLINTAAYLQFEMNPIAALRIVTGLRYDRVHYDFTNRLTTSTRYKPKETNTFNIIAPKLGLTYNLGRNNGLYSNFSVGFQPPETSFLYSSRQKVALRQASFYNYEAGAWFTVGKRMYFEVNVYNMDGKNEIISALQPDNTTQNQNAGATRHTGVEYTLNYAPLSSLTFRFSGTNARHTYIDYSEVRTIGGVPASVVYNGNRMNNSPAWIANSEITYKPLFFKGFRVSAEWQHINSYFTDPGNTKKYNGYDIGNLRFGYDFRKALGGAGIWLNVLNVSDQLYASNVTSGQFGDSYTAAPPRTFSLGLNYPMSKHSTNGKD